MSTLTSDFVLNQTAQRVIRIAQALARENMHAFFAPSHLLKALLHKDADLTDRLQKMDADVYYLEEWAEVRMENEKKTSTPPDPVSGTPAIDSTINEADSIRLKLMNDHIEPIHLLAALVTPGVAFSFEQLKTLPLQREDILDTLTVNGEIKGPAGKTNGKSNQGTKTTQAALLKYCVDKTLMATEGKLDAVIGRDKEIRMMSEILCRRSKPNVLITGEPGVGKSSLVDAFTIAIFNQQVPKQLANARVFELDTGSLVAGASYKGEIEDRLKSILAEIKQFEKAILFIDEIHTVIDKNGAAGGAVNMLKPELARGEITLIGATTSDEYRKFIEPDEALSRRFELLQVDEPEATACFHMIKAVAHKYETHHGLLVPDDTIKETIRLAKRYIKDRRLPDAAIDLTDRSLAALRMINDTGEKDLENFEQLYNQYAADIEKNERLEDWYWLYLQMRNRLSPILWGQFESEENPDAFTRVDEIKTYLRKVLDTLKGAAIIKHKELMGSNVAAIVSFKTGIPIGKVQTQEKERLLNMEAVLKQRLIGQDHAVKNISEAILESRSGLSKPGQPIGSFFFLGPTGTGKTELTKALASFLFQDESFLIRFDMSEFKEEHSAALLYGASPGYVGYEEGGLLVNKIRQNPYAVVLFDEIEKAHSSVFDIFLQILDEGKLHDKLGKEGDFSNAVIIFTSNIGSQYVVDSFNKGEIPSSAKLLEIMSQHFRPEFLGRLTEIVPFAPMNESMVQKILQIQLAGLYATLQKQGISLTVSPQAAGLLAQLGFTPRYGARPLTAVVRSQLRRPLSRKIISGEIHAGSNISLEVDANNEFCWKTAAGDQPQNGT